MSAIFLSHSSKDNAIAGEIGEYLASVGHRSLFLDFHPENGIPPGRNWEQELYHRLRSCQAVLVLCSEHSMASKWVFAEITHARALGKPLIPIKLEECEVLSLLSGVQLLDFTGDRDEAYRRLWRGLKEEAGLDPRSAFDWDGSRAPYPGLFSFEKEDAAVFFGRDREIQEGLDLLRSLQRLGGARMVLVTGASGSGKSSLVRAGVLPNLALDRGSWLVTCPFRPQPRPFPRTDPFKELAIALAETLGEHGQTRDWKEIRATQTQAAERDPVRGDSLEELADDLRIASGCRNATVLLVIDQLEELLTNADPAQARRFLNLLSATLSEPSTPLMLLCTLRSDFVERFQGFLEATVGRELKPKLLRVPAVSTDQWAHIIEGPAEKAGVQLEAGLVLAMVHDTATEDALPLLAYTLRELWERFGQDGLVTIEEYREKLGGLAGSVVRASERIFATLQLSKEEEEDLRTAFAARLVSVNEEGQYVRRTARWVDLPERIHGVLEHFVSARLLVSRYEGAEREIEVAHETLFRSWPRLRKWLEENEEFLVWRRRLRERAREWERTGHDPGALLRGIPLTEAKGWFEQRASDLEEGEGAFIVQSLRAEEERVRAEAERLRAEAAQRRARRLTLAGLAAAVVAVLLLSVWRVVERARTAEQLWAAAMLTRAENEPDTLAATLLLTELLGRDEPPGGTALARRLADHAAEYMPLALYRRENDEVVLRADLSDATAGVRMVTALNGIVRLRRTEQGSEPVVIAGHRDQVHSAAFSADYTRVVTASEDGSVRVWRIADGRELRVLGEGLPPAVSVGFSSDGSRVAAGFVDGTARMWSVDAPADTVVLPTPGDGPVLSVGFSRDGSRVLAASRDGARVWPLAGGSSVELPAGETILWSAAFSPDGARVATTHDDGTVRLWPANGTGPPVVLARHKGVVWSATFSPDGSRLVTASADGTARVWRTDTGEEQRVLRGHGGEVVSAHFGREGDRVLTVSRDGALRVWALEPARDPLLLRGHTGQLWSVAFSPDGTRVLSTSEDSTVRVWSADGVGAPVAAVKLQGPVTAAAFSRDGARVVAVAGSSAWVCGADLAGCREVLVHEGGISRVAFSPDGGRIASAANDGRVQVGWSDGSRAPLQLGAHHGWVRIAVFSPNGAHLLTAGRDGTARVWRADGNGEPRILRGHQDAIMDAAFSRDGKRVVTASDDGTARVWSADGRELRILPHDERVWLAAFTPDGSRVVTVTEERRIRIWRPDGEDPPLLLGRHDGRVRSLEITPDGRRVLTTSVDGTARVWSVEGRGEPAILRVGSRVQSGAFDPAGEHVVTASDDGVVRIWRADWQALLEFLRGATSVCLTSEQRSELLSESSDQARRALAECQRRHGRRSPVS